MKEAEKGKVSGMVKLKELVHKWQNNVTLSCSNDEEAISGISPQVSRRLRSATLTTVASSDSEDEGTSSSPRDVPKGYLAVYVGFELRRFIIPTTYLSHKLFKTLLQKAEEEYGFDHGGAITIPCEIETFKYLLHCIHNESNPLFTQRDPSSTESSSGISQENNNVSHFAH